ncbi:hypothetical protein OB920_13320 [Halobacteria archaeon HArc-gm2]|nr:hypothetical protein [Halobacteria archaeon HArc-gm2]
MYKTYRTSLDEVVDIDHDHREELTTTFVSAANYYTNHGISSETVWPALAQGYTNLTDDGVSPTPTHSQREQYFHSHFDLSEWVEMTDEGRDRHTNELMANLVKEVAGDF